MNNIRQLFFPYGMARNSDGSWTFFNRKYKPTGVVADGWAEWDDPHHKVFLKGLTKAKLAELDIEGAGDGERIYFYSDATHPDQSAKDLSSYLEKLQILLKLEVGSD